MTTWLRVLTFLFKYGPAIYKIVYEIMTLLGWLGKNAALQTLPDNASVMAFNDKKAVLRTLHVMAKDCRQTKDLSRLVNYRNTLATEKWKIYKDTHDV